MMEKDRELVDKDLSIRKMLIYPAVRALAAVGFVVLCIGAIFCLLQGCESKTQVETSNDKPTFVSSDGTLRMWKVDGKLHREGAPSVIQDGSYQAYYLWGELHNDDGPAVIWEDGLEYYWRYGKLHRVGGPAVTHPNGRKEWWFEGQRHRVGGPAVIHASGHMEWWERGVKIPDPE